MLEQAQPKWIKGMMVLEIVVLSVTALVPVLIVGGALAWILDLITFGGLSIGSWSGDDGVWRGIMLLGRYFAVGSVVFTPISGVCLGLSIVQRRRFQTPNSAVVIILSAVHLGMVLAWALKTFLLKG